MRNKVSKIFIFFRELFDFLWFLFQLVRKNYYSNPFSDEYTGAVAVLANGPSLKKELDFLMGIKNSNYSDYIVLNYFAFDYCFLLLKPRHYCLADPMFFQRSHKENDVKKLFLIFEEKIDWPMKLYIPANHYKKFIEFSDIKNKNILVIKVNTTPYSGFENLRFFFYKKNLAMPKVQTVANLAIFVGLNSGYQLLDIYGVDHTFFDSLCVNDKNQLCNKETHFYNDQQSLKPILRTDTNEVFKISDYLNATMHMFKSHELLAEYAKFLNVKIINCTTNSMIDSYERREA